jgi:hypothetical protein
MVLPAPMTPVAAAAPAARVLFKGKDGTYTASVFVATTPKRAWAVLTNYEGLAGQLPDLKASKLLKRQGNKLELWSEEVWDGKRDGWLKESNNMAELSEELQSLSL